ncbi:unnamed protein product [Gongylonema pulchrum]|uniref:C3H1-type domain-containing protein n=1 Tax=Gongylonema pulchrum TaxID=637853 RepID=A0A183CV69_9BILA|nr:unnamed protein product [Gongylonema pulchrum]
MLIRLVCPFSAVSFLKARVQVRAPGVDAMVASGVDVCRMLMLPSACFLSDIKIAAFAKEFVDKGCSVQYTDVSANNSHTLPQTPISNVFDSTSLPFPLLPYFMPHSLGLMQQLAFPYYQNIASMVASGIPPRGDAGAASGATAPASAFDIIAATNVSAGKQMAMQEGKEEDSLSLKEAKIELFSDDEEDSEDNDETSDSNDISGNSGQESECNINVCRNIEPEAGDQPFRGEILNCGAAAARDYESESVNDYPLLPATAGLCYSAVVKGIKPTNKNSKAIYCPSRDCSNTTSYRSSSSINPASVQSAQWDQIVTDRTGKFNKPAPQCFHWNNPKHRLDYPCRYWHPREQCRFYPKCTNTADECGFAHPFCGEFCRCPEGKRDPQKNHRLPEEKCLGEIILQFYE